MAEIDEGVLAQFQNVDAFVRRGLANPKTRRKILEVQKTLNPDTAIPELDESDPLREEIKTLRSEWQTEREARAEAERTREEKERLGQLTSKWSEGQILARKRGYADEGLNNLEKFMEEHSIGSHAAAIPYYEQLHPPPTPAVSSGTRWDFFGAQPDDGPDLKPLYEGHDEQFLNQTIADTLNRVRNGG
ncbi:MAG TPA: hypothetical protein VLN57_05190 [Xanthobacteraceae bacterium]|nr:hypothetical protein [Xanthobacteraceae bacterium]